MTGNWTAATWDRMSTRGKKRPIREDGVLKEESTAAQRVRMSTAAIP